MPPEAQPAPYGYGPGPDPRYVYGPGPAPQPGYPQPGYPQAGMPPYGYYQQPMPLTRMPGSVRAAQVMSFLLGGLGVLLIIVAGMTAGAERAGAITAGFMLPIVLSCFAFGFARGGNGIRITAIVLASLEMVFALGSSISGMPPGMLGFGISMATVITLSQRSARAWFKRNQAQQFS